MDVSREGDLRLLNQKRNDSSLPMSVREQAHRAYESIIEQMNNKPLVEARHRLMKASEAGDMKAVEKIQQEIHHRFGR